MISNKEKAILREYNKLAKAMDKDQKRARDLLKSKLAWGEKVDADEIRETAQDWTFNPQACFIIWLTAEKCYKNLRDRKRKRK